LPRAFTITANGRFCWYYTRKGLPFHFVNVPDETEPDEGWRHDGVAIDDLQSGSRIALLPTLPSPDYYDSMEVAADGRTAVALSYSNHLELILWDLATSKVRARLRHPAISGDPSSTAHMWYSPDSSLVFFQFGDVVVWWDASNGAPRGYAKKI